MNPLGISYTQERSRQSETDLWCIVRDSFGPVKRVEADIEVRRQKRGERKKFVIIIL